MARLIPDTIAARMLVVLIIGLSVSHLASMAFYFTDRSSLVLFSSGAALGERIATIVRLIEDAPPADRSHLIELAEDNRLHVVLSPDSFLASKYADDLQGNVLGNALIEHLSDGAQRTFRHLHAEVPASEAWQEHLSNSQEGGGAVGEMVMASVQLGDGNWLNFAAQPRAPDPILSLRFALSMGVMLLAVVVLSAIVVRHVTGPLRSFADAARRFGTDVKSSPMPEFGPTEVCEATRALNEMHDRIRHFAEDRTQMIAAISHDLGTPITRLRLRAELIDDEEQQRKMLADLEDIEKMIGSALTFARDDAAVEPRMTVDLRTLLQRVCDDLSDAGHDVTVCVADSAQPYTCRPAALRRALSNLIENAAKYGQRAQVSLNGGAEAMVITIEDDGPGIPENLHEQAFKPFRRLETSRNRETGGTGLGLTVARTIVLAHGGEITLTNRNGGGLNVEVRLPQ